jgi:hypothetical protein
VIPSFDVFLGGWATSPPSKISPLAVRSFVTRHDQDLLNRETEYLTRIGMFVI